jgi:RecA/RadA recombinase
MKNKITKSNSNTVALAFFGASLASLAATAYFFFGPKGKKNQRHTKAWAIKMKGDVVEKLEMVRDVSEPIYHEIIDSVAAEYEKNKKAGSKEIKELAQDMKKHWKTISKSARTIKSNTAQGIKKVAKKA